MFVFKKLIQFYKLLLSTCEYNLFFNLDKMFLNIEYLQANEMKYTMTDEEKKKELENPDDKIDYMSYTLEELEATEP